MLYSSGRAKVVLFFVFIFVFYMSNVMFLGTGDGWSARMLPISILNEGNLDLDEFMGKDSKGDFNVFIPIRGDHFVSKFPVLTSFLALPIYVIPYLLNVEFNTSLVLELAKTSAALITVMSAVFMYLIFRKFLSQRWSLVLTLLYAFGTSSWTISSQDLWQHGALQLFLAMTIYFALQKVKTKQNIFVVGLCAGLTIAARYLGVILIVPIAVYFLYKHREYFLYFIAGITIPLALLALYNTYYFGLPWITGYGCESYINTGIQCMEGYYNPLWEGLGGILISPSHGLFVFTPFLLFSVWGAVAIWRKKNQQDEYSLLLRYLLFGVVAHLLLLSKWWTWFGGMTYGPRMLVDIVPILMLMFIPIIRNGLFKNKLLLALLFLSGIFSVLVQFVGVIYCDYSWYDLYVSSTSHAWLWDWKQSQLLYYLGKLF